MLRKLALAGVAALLLTAGACGDDEKADPSTDGTETDTESSTVTTPTSPATDSTTTTLNVEEQVKAAYLAYWEMVVRLTSAPNLDDPELAQRAADPILGFIRDDLNTRIVNGTREVLPEDPSHYSHTVLSVSLAGTSAELVDCFVDGRVQLAADGSVTNADVVTKRTRATLSLIGGTWKVNDAQFLTRTPGVVTCDT